MFKNLFNNIGSKIMGVVKFFFYLNVGIAAAAVLIVTLIAMSEDFAAGLITLVIGAIIGVIYLVFVYLGMLCLYGFGELVQCNIEQRDLLRGMTGAAPGYVPAEPPRCEAPRPKSEAKRAPESKPVTGEWSEPAPAPVSGPVSAAKGERKAVCPRCGARQLEGTVNCKYCGTAMR